MEMFHVEQLRRSLCWRLWNGLAGAAWCECCLEVGGSGLGVKGICGVTWDGVKLGFEKLLGRVALSLGLLSYVGVCGVTWDGVKLGVEKLLGWVALSLGLLSYGGFFGTAWSLEESWSLWSGLVGRLVFGGLEAFLCKVALSFLIVGVRGRFI